MDEQQLKKDAAKKQLDKLDGRLGKGVGAVKERGKLNKIVKG